MQKSSVGSWAGPFALPPIWVSLSLYNTRLCQEGHPAKSLPNHPCNKLKGEQQLSNFLQLEQKQHFAYSKSVFCSSFIYKYCVLCSLVLVMVLPFNVAFCSSSAVRFSRKERSHGRLSSAGLFSAVFIQPDFFLVFGDPDRGTAALRRRCGQARSAN